MDPVAMGVIQGLGRHYQQQLTIAETACMHKGAATCTLRVKAA
jgi:predicted hydrocarbon binding protein